MPGEPTNPITQLLASIGRGESAARDQFWAAVYEELHRMARVQMAREGLGRTLQPTALVHEAYLRLFPGGDGSFENRRHFFAAAAIAMHRILVDDARRRGRLKRGGGVEPHRLEPGVMDPAVLDDAPGLVLAVDDALAKLKEQRPDLVELVQLRFFAGLNLDETANVLGVARRTVVNRWRLARALLYGMLQDGEAPRPG